MSPATRTTTIETPDITTTDTAASEERQSFEAAWQARRVVASWQELAGGFAALVAWFLLFAGGILIGTQPYIAALMSETPAINLYWAAVVVMLFWTITNVGLLSCLAAVLGAFGGRTRFTAKVAASDTDFRQDIAAAARRPARATCIHYTSALMRGFGVYALVLSGLLVLATDALMTPSQEQYVRMAALVSVVSFYAGYDPAMFASILQRVERFLRN